LKPADFAAYGPGFVTQAVSGQEPGFALVSHFILFGVFYYAVLGMRTRKVRHYWAAAVLFVSTLGPSGRGLTVCAAATLLFFLYRLRGFRRTFVAAVKFGCIAAVLGGILYAVIPSVLSARIAGFSDAFAVLLTGSTTQDNSANARIFETLTALPYIEEHPLLGNGVVSHQWQGGSEGALGEYFYATDIGVIGVMFSYGAFGMVLYLLQYLFAWSSAKKLPASFHSPLLDATKAFVLYSAIYSLMSGMFVWDAEVTLFFIVLLREMAAQTNVASESFDARIGRECSLQRPA